MFKKCHTCGHVWPSREQWLCDPSLKLIGYQANFKAVKTGIFLFNHRCRTTLALQAADFEDLYDGPIYVERATGTKECPGHCLHKDNFEACPARCECAYVRHILQLIKNWPKEKG
jgi:hypothetical protein